MLMALAVLAMRLAAQPSETIHMLGFISNYFYNIYIL
jgi:hypothetical protein